MNNKKTSNLLRLIAFFLTSVILICTFGFTVDGWMIKDDDENDAYEDKNDSETNIVPDRPDNGTIEDPLPTLPEIYIPEYVNSLTGLECTEEIAESSPVCFVVDTKGVISGIYGTDILAEIPTEEGNTRLLCIRRDINNLWKIGSLTATRDYISNISAFFGSALISVGNDDAVNYPGCNVSQSHLDLSISNGYHYTEFTSYAYTNTDLVKKALADTGISGNKSSTILPYNFPDFGKELITLDTKADKILISYSSNNQTELIFDIESGRYIFEKNGEKIKDSTNGKTPEFTNCLILFADSITYDNSNGSYMVMDTVGSGSGFYFTAGSMCDINWTSTEAGILTLYKSNGEKLTINRGCTYISYFKSSKTDSVSYS